MFSAGVMLWDKLEEPAMDSDPFCTPKSDRFKENEFKKAVSPISMLRFWFRSVNTSVFEAFNPTLRPPVICPRAL